MSGVTKETVGTKPRFRFWKKFRCRCSNKNRHLDPQAVIARPSQGREPKLEDVPGAIDNVRRAHTRFGLPKLRLPDLPPLGCMKTATDSISSDYIRYTEDTTESLNSLEKMRLDELVRNLEKKQTNSPYFREVPNEGPYAGHQPLASTPRAARDGVPRAAVTPREYGRRQGLDDFKASPIPGAQREQNFFAFPPYRPEDLIR